MTADVHISLAGRGDLSARIYRQLLDAVLDGRLRPGERLPPSRELARQLDVSRNTAALAYERLVAEGFLVGKVGAGTYVRGDVTTTRRSRRAPGGSGVRPRPVWLDLPEPARGGRVAPRYDFGVGVPDVTLFPWQTWRRLIATELRASSVHYGDYGDPSGHSGLRAAVARHIGVSRSVRAGADDVLITHGAQQALDLIGRVLVEPGTCVAMEQPGYAPVHSLFTALGARVVGVPVDGEGVDVTAIPRAARLLYVTPSHQFPLGVAMSPQRRAAVLDWAVRHDGVVIEDDYDTEFRYSDRPLEPLQSLDRAGRVVYVGSFSKTMLPTLRVGFLVAPASLQPALRTAKQLADWSGDLATQAALARFIDDGLFARHVRRSTRAYALRREEIMSTLARDFAKWLEVVPSGAGMHLCASRRPGTDVDIDAAVRLARGAGVGARSLTELGDTIHSGLVLGFGAIPDERIAPGLRALARAFAAAAA